MAVTAVVEGLLQLLMFIFTSKVSALRVGPLYYPAT